MGCAGGTTGCATMMSMVGALTRPRILSDGVYFERTAFGSDGVEVNRSVAALGGNIFVHRIPRDALHVVRVLRDFLNTRSIACVKDSGGVIGTSSYDPFPIRTPSKIVDLPRRTPDDDA
jgi:hypothetical protein